MRGVSPSILSKLFVPLVLPAVIAAGCSDRDLRPLTPCTTAGVSRNVPIQSLKNVDLVFLVDNSGSMASEQAKLRAEFPTMIRALATGDTDGDGTQDGPPVESLRVAVITSDMGVLGVGVPPPNGVGPALSSCGSGTGGELVRRANYGDDGRFRTTTRAIPLVTDCDFDNNGSTQDTVPVADLPTFLTFDNPGGGTIPDNDPELVEFNQRVSCLTNVGLDGCAFEQQLEALLKAITPSTEVPEGGPFHSAPNDTAGALGHGDDPATNDPDPDGDGVGWFRDDSLLALVMVSDEDDCSARNREIFNSNSTVAPFNADGTGTPALNVIQTRCPRHEADGLWPVERYIKGYIARRSLSPGAFVFAAITGVPEDLTDEIISLPNQDPIIEGTDNLQEILDDPRMAYRYVTSEQGNANGGIDYACQHFDTDNEVTIHADAVSNGTSLTNVTITDGPASTSFMAQISVPGGSNPRAANYAVVPGDRVPEPGMTISGALFAPNTRIVSVVQGPTVFGLTLSRAATPGTAMAATLDAGARGPFNRTFVFGTGIPEGTRIDDVTTTDTTTTITLTQAVTIGSNTDDIVLRFRDVEAVPARRAVRVAQGLVGAPYFSNATISSICVDTFRPAMNRIIALIQQNLRGSCLPRSLVRNAQNQVNCDVFVTMPPNTSCDDPTFGGAYAPTADRTVPAPDGVADADGLLQVCRMLQVPVTATDIGTNNPPTSARGWFYDDYTDESESCGVSTAYRVSFTKTGSTDDTPPQGARMSFSCAQQVQDGDLEIDINSPCNGSATAGASCVFTNEAAGDEFSLRYNLFNRDFSYATANDQASRFNCEYDSNTCQVACDSDAQCPGGFVCYDDPNDDDGVQAGMQSFCVNPVCGTD